MCPTGKVAYPTEAAATAAVRGIRRHRRGDVRRVDVYRCGACPSWHLGSRDLRPNGVRRRRR